MAARARAARRGPAAAAARGRSIASWGAILKWQRDEETCQGGNVQELETYLCSGRRRFFYAASGSIPVWMKVVAMALSRPLEVLATALDSEAR